MPPDADLTSRSLIGCAPVEVAVHGAILQLAGGGAVQVAHQCCPILGIRPVALHTADGLPKKAAQGGLPPVAHHPVPASAWLLHATAEQVLPSGHTRRSYLQSTPSSLSVISLSPASFARKAHSEYAHCPLPAPCALCGYCTRLSLDGSVCKLVTCTAGCQLGQPNPHHESLAPPHCRQVCRQSGQSSGRCSRLTVHTKKPRNFQVGEGICT